MKIQYQKEEPVGIGRLVSEDLGEIDFILTVDSSETVVIDRQDMLDDNLQGHSTLKWRETVRMALSSPSALLFPEEVIDRAVNSSPNLQRFTVLYWLFKVRVPSLDVVLSRKIDGLNMDGFGKSLLAIRMAAVGRAQAWMIQEVGDAVLWEILLNTGFKSAENFSYVHKVIEEFLSNNYGASRLYTLSYDPDYNPKEYISILSKLCYKQISTQWMRKKL